MLADYLFRKKSSSQGALSQNKDFALSIKKQHWQKLNCGIRKKTVHPRFEREARKFNVRLK